MKSPEQRREERRQYESDVFFEVWRAGGNPDRISDDRVDDAHWAGDSPERAAAEELRRQRTPARSEEPVDNWGDWGQE